MAVLNQAVSGILVTISNKSFASLVFTFLIFILMYSILARLLARTIGQGQVTKSVKAIALTMSGIIVLSLFFGATETQFIQRVSQIASTISTLFGFVAGFFVFFLFRYSLFSSTEKEEAEAFGANLRDLMSFLGAGAALYTMGVFGNNDLLLAFGTVLFIITGVFFLLALFGGFGGKVDLYKRCEHELKQVEDAAKKTEYSFKSKEKLYDDDTKKIFREKISEFNIKRTEYRKTGRDYILNKDKAEKDKCLKKMSDLLEDLKKLVDDMERALRKQR